MADVLTTRLDPVEGLVNYTLFTKPYHTKILEVLVEYIHTDCLDVTIEEGFWLSLGMPDPELLPLWGWTLEEAQQFFNCEFQSFQICEVNPTSGYFEVVGDYASKFTVGETILVQTDQLKFTEFTVSAISTNSEQLTTITQSCDDGSPPPDCQSYTDTDCAWTAGSPLDTIVEDPGRVIQCRNDIRYTGEQTKTRIEVSETLAPNFPSTGVIFPSSCWVYNEDYDVYQFRGGIVWPSLVHVAKNTNCGGWGTIWDSQNIGALGTANTILGGDGDENYIEIDNTVGVPAEIASWADAYTYGVKVLISGSTDAGIDGEYEVLLSHLTYTGTPLVATNTLRIYFTGNIPADVIDGDVQIIPWGYDEPKKCVDQGQSLTAEASIAEDMQITLNDIGTNIVQGWDMQFWDTAGYDGGPFTFTVAFT